MKVPLSIRQLYYEKQPLAIELQKRIDSELGAQRPRSWHYLSRVKLIESFSQKLETGRVTDPNDMEDLFACTLVVENARYISGAVDLVKSVCDIRRRRPDRDDRTHKAPECFPFDDLRLYVRYRDSDSLPPSGVAQITFEVQIKTYLQHAWSIATHDLTYKAGSVNWAMSRVAFQIRAVLEHVEAAIDQVDGLANSTLIAKSDRATRELIDVLAWLAATWEADFLPPDQLRLARGVVELTQGLKISIQQVQEMVAAETRQGRGAQLLNVSPYGAILQSILLQAPEVIERFVCEFEGSRFKLFVPQEVSLPPSIIASNADPQFHKRWNRRVVSI